MVNTRKHQPPALETPEYSNLYAFNYKFNDENILRNDPIVGAFETYFAEAEELNTEAKALIANYTKKKVWFFLIIKYI